MFGLHLFRRHAAEMVDELEVRHACARLLFRGKDEGVGYNLSSLALPTCGAVIAPRAF
jgi:hypothetical protein